MSACLMFGTPCAWCIAGKYYYGGLETETQLGAWRPTMDWRGEYSYDPHDMCRVEMTFRRTILQVPKKELPRGTPIFDFGASVYLDGVFGGGYLEMVPVEVWVTRRNTNNTVDKFSFDVFGLRKSKYLGGLRIAGLPNVEFLPGDTLGQLWGLASGSGQTMGVQFSKGSDEIGDGQLTDKELNRSTQLRRVPPCSSFSITSKWVWMDEVEPET